MLRIKKRLSQKRVHVIRHRGRAPRVRLAERNQVVHPFYGILIQTLVAHLLYQRDLVTAVKLDVLEHHDVLLGKQVARLPVRAVGVVLHLQLNQEVREDTPQIRELEKPGLSRW